MIVHELKHALEAAAAGSKQALEAFLKKYGWITATGHPETKGAQEAKDSFDADSRDESDDIELDDEVDVTTTTRLDANNLPEEERKNDDEN